MKNIYKHVISIAVFISLTVYLFNPVFFENKGIKQHDIEQWKYSANETIEFRKKNNEEALWSNSCLLYTSPSPRDTLLSRMPSSA